MNKVHWFLIALAVCVLGGYWYYYRHGSAAITGSVYITPPPHHRGSVSPCVAKASISPCAGFGGVPSPSTPLLNIPCKSRHESGALNDEFNRQTRIISGSSRGFGGCGAATQPVVRNTYGLPNIGSLYLGASIAYTGDTVPYVPLDSKCGTYGCINDVQAIIKPELVVPGNAWRFKGRRGSVVIELAKRSLITGFTYIHPSKEYMPKGFYAYHTSALKEFSAIGLKSSADTSGVELGNFTYHESGSQAQTYSVMKKCQGEPHKAILVNFVKNYGNCNYTSVYRIEVHGVVAES